MNSAKFIVNKMHQQTKSFRLALLLCLCTALWFSLGGTLKVWIAQANGKTIEMVVCSGAGIKKIYVKVAGSEATNHEVSLKHCSNTPLALMAEEVNTPEHLAYAQPVTPTAWHWNDGLRIERDWLRNGKPPPGRAPPAVFTA
jgi:hypothetical protein